MRKARRLKNSHYRIFSDALQAQQGLFNDLIVGGEESGQRWYIARAPHHVSADNHLTNAALLRYYLHCIIQGSLREYLREVEIECIG